MKLTNNTPPIFSKYQETSIKAPSVEDGNALANDIKQGKIYTSEVDPVAGYDVNYAAAITDVKSTIYTTGTNFIYVIGMTYVATFQSPIATDPGYYGSNIFKAGEAFVIKGQNNDWVRGNIAKVIDITPTPGPLPAEITFDVKLSCTIIQGDPLAISVNDEFFMKRQIYQDESTFNEAFAPVNLTATFDLLDGHGYFYWDDINQESRKYVLSLRNIASTATPQPRLIAVNGKVANPSTTFKALITSSGGINTVEIINGGEHGISNKSLITKGTGTGTAGFTKRDSSGKLLINEFTFYDAVVGSNIIYVYSDAPTNVGSNQSLADQIAQYPDPNYNTYVEGLPPLPFTNDYYVFTKGVPPGKPTTGRYVALGLHNAASGLPIVITAAWKNSMLNKKIKTHDGVLLTSTGSGYVGKAVITEEQIPARSRWFYNPAIYGTLAAGTYAWTVCAIYDEINKLYTEWAPEEYITIL